MSTRRAISLAELLIVMSILVTLVPLAIGFVTRAMHQHQASRRRDDAHRVLENFTRQFREDVHAMQTACRVTDVGQDELQLEAANGVRIVYGFASFGAEVERTLTRDGELQHRDSYSIGEENQVTCDLEEAGHTIRLQVWLRLPQAAGQRRLQSWTTCRVAQDWRFVPREDWNKPATWDTSESALALTQAEGGSP